MRKKCVAESYFADFPWIIASQPRYEKCRFSKIFFERVSVMGSYLAMILASLQYAEIMQSNTNCHGLLDANHYKLNDMVLC
jgi:hypothetical protein